MGPGPMTPAVRAIVFANVGAFVLTFVAPDLMIDLFGLSPRAVLEQGRFWQLFTYLFVHDPNGFMHILFNMLALWMFGVALERRWGTTGFVKYYFLTGVGAGVVTLIAALTPFAPLRALYEASTIGASGAIYGLLMAWAILFPDATILFMLVFPMRVRVAAMIMGAIAFFSAVGGRNGSVAEATHLAGLLVGWLYLKGPRNLRLDLKYRLTRWRMERMRKRFNVHQGGRRDDWSDRVH
jgi:membrane associated rhomboid family serine protease